MGAKFEPHPEGYKGAAELVEGLRKRHLFEISVAAYPETHPDAQRAQSDIDNLKRKLDAGATRAITKFFFEPDTFFRFREAVAAAGSSEARRVGTEGVSTVRSRGSLAI